MAANYEQLISSKPKKDKPLGARYTVPEAEESCGTSDKDCLNKAIECAALMVTLDQVREIFPGYLLPPFCHDQTVRSILWTMVSLVA